MSVAPTPRSRAHGPGAWAATLAAGAQVLLRASAGVLGSVAIVLTLGLLAWGPVGAPAQGIAAAFATTIVGGLVVGLFSRGTVPTAGPSSATALMLAGLLVALAAPQGNGTPGLSGPTLWLAAGAAVAVMGVVQLVLALAGLARLVHHVPRAVLSGFLNGVALLILVAQLPVLWPHGAPGPLLLGLGAAALVLALARWRPGWPAALVALLAGTAVWHGVQAAGSNPAAPLLGPLLGPGLGGWPWPLALQAALQGPGLAALQPHLGSIVLTGVLLGLVGTLESLLNLAAVELAYDRTPDARRELAALGLANLLGGLFAALPAQSVRARAEGMRQAGALGRGAAVSAALLSLLLALWGGPLLAQLPAAVLAGLMVAIAVTLVDRWSLRLALELWRQPHAARDMATAGPLAVMLLVCGLTVGLGLAVGVAAGLVLSVLVFMRGLNRSLIRARHPGHERPSRRVWSAQDEARLAPLRAQVQLIELEGALFFGNTQRLQDEALPPDTPCRWLVLDLRRLSTVDESGAVGLRALAVALSRRGVRLLLAGVAPGRGLGPQLAVLGLGPDDAALPWFATADQAMEHAEQALLGADARPPARLALRDCDLAVGLDAARADALQARLPVRRLAAGEPLFRQGDAADALFVVLSGSVSAVGADAGQPQRYSSLGAGRMVGEAALLTGAGRSATVLADTELDLLVLPREQLEDLARTDPELALVLMRNIATHLADRLGAATVAWHRSAG